MADLSIGTAITPVLTKWRNNGCLMKTINASAGVDATEMAPSGAGKINVLVGGRITASKACTVVFSSAGNQLDQLEFSGVDTKFVPVGLQTVAGEALNITNADAATLSGYFVYKLAKPGEFVPLD